MSQCKSHLCSLIENKANQTHEVFACDVWRSWKAENERELMCVGIMCFIFDFSCVNVLSFLFWTGKTDRASYSFGRDSSIHGCHQVRSSQIFPLIWLVLRNTSRGFVEFSVVFQFVSKNRNNIFIFTPFSLIAACEKRLRRYRDVSFVSGLLFHGSWNGVIKWMWKAYFRWEMFEKKGICFIPL